MAHRLPSYSKAETTEHDHIIPSHNDSLVPNRNIAQRKGRRSGPKMKHMIRIIHAALLIGTMVIVTSFSRYMERSLPRELLVTDTSRARQRTFPRIVLCLLNDQNQTVTDSSYLQCRPLLDSVSALEPTYYNHPENFLYPLKPHRTTLLLASEPDATRFYSDVNVSSSDLPTMEHRIYPKHEYDPHCEPIEPSWQSTFYPVCNEMHAQSMADELLEKSLSILSSKGFWRLAWKKESMAGSNLHDEGDSTLTVWKTFKIQHNFEEAFYENNRVDAVAMERLTASRNIIDIYAFCGTSVVTEFAGKELSVLVNKLNSTQRLEMAVQVAKGLADVHGITSNRPSLVHNDVNLANLVLTRDNRAVLNDFNIAVLLMKHNETGETCPFVSHFPNPQWRAPEEQVASEEVSTFHPPRVTEKTDIYALGNVFYRLAVGSSPWKQPNTHKVTAKQKAIIAQMKRSNGATPPVPKCIVEYYDPAVQVLLEAMRRAYRFKPEDRPSAISFVRFLSLALKEIRIMDLSHHIPLWDGTATRKANADVTGQLVNVTIGNAICGVGLAGAKIHAERLLGY